MIATQHFITDMPEGYTPGHLRALLTKVAPDVLAVEAPTNVPDPWSCAPYELWNVTKPWAVTNDVEVLPTGWQDAEYGFALARMCELLMENGDWGKYQETEQKFQTSYAAQPLTCQFVNSAAHHSIWRDYHGELHRLMGADTPWEQWNSEILRNVQQVCRAHPGQRVAVVFGGAHAYYLLDGLAQDTSVTIIPAEQFFPLTEEEVESSAMPVDYLKALRPLNFDDVTGEQLAQASWLLEKVKEDPEFSGDYVLFLGKKLMHEGKYEDALAEFERLMNYPRIAVSRFDGKSLLAEVACVYAGTALSRMGESRKARQRLAKIVDDESITPTTRLWAQQVLDGIAAE